SRGQGDGDRRWQAPRLLPDQRLEVGALRPREGPGREAQHRRPSRRQGARAGAGGLDRRPARPRGWQVSERAAFRNPTPTGDIIIELADAPGKVVFIVRKNEPLGLALPGGFVDEGEFVADAAIREAREETGLDVELTELFHVYSDPARDKRQHT